MTPPYKQVQFWVVVLALTSGRALGFTCPYRRNPLVASSASGSASRLTKYSICEQQQQQPSPDMTMSMANESDMSRVDFVSKMLMASLVTSLVPGVANGFDGGVGGLGKTRPQTGVIFRDPEAAAEISPSSSGDVNYELISPDGTPVLLSFSAPWPLLKSTVGIAARDVTGGFESTFVQVVELPDGVTSLDNIKPGLLSQSIFASTGKFGMYGSPTDIRIKKIPEQSSDTSGTSVYQASFTTLTPAMIESDRKAYISASVVGNGLFLLVTTTTSVRFKKLEGELRKVADSFSAISAPKSNLNLRKS